MSVKPTAPDLEQANLFAWRAPLSQDWMERWQNADSAVRALAAGQPPLLPANQLCNLLRGLANERLGPREQTKLENTAARLVALPDFDQLRRFRLGLVGHLTLDFLVRPLRAAALARGLLLDVHIAPFDSVASTAFGGSAAFAGTKLDAVAVVLDGDAAAFTTTLLDSGSEEAALAHASSLLQGAAAAIRTMSSATPILATTTTRRRLADVDLALPGSPARFVQRLNDMVVAGAQRRDWVLWDLAGLAAQTGLNQWFDPVQSLMAKSPFALRYTPLAADHLCGLLAAMCGKSGRAAVLDLDNTVWGGVIGDDGLAGIRLGRGTPEGEAFSEFQGFILGLRERGIVLCVCSKNDASTALEAIRTHPDMMLREEHFAVCQINWDDKAANIRAIADKLNLSLESLVFIDDNPAERARVRQELPLVAVPELGNDPAEYPFLIARSGVFQHLALSREDVERPRDYEAAGRREQLRQASSSYDAYLASLQMKLMVGRFDDLGRSRITQLINKTNQFNLTTRRYNEEDVRRFEDDRDGVLCWQVRLRDRFVDHGIIGVVIVRKRADNWTIDTWLQSCRILQRRVEHAVMNLVMAQARKENARTVTGEFIASGRNAMVSRFYEEMGFTPLPESETGPLHRYVLVPASFEPFACAFEIDEKDTKDMSQ